MLILLIIVIISLADLGSNFTSQYSRVCVKKIAIYMMIIRVGKWSRVSRETRLKIGLAISRDLKCETCKTQKLAKIMHFGSF